ncbi:MAG: histidinol-phosphatase [Lachnospiraceae bacterium]|nr:histidinol-phosphatase [Lachnospiraceae bacterium]
MLANYHTHTVRCKHAKGTEREYIEAAIANGFKVLGFSDHVPQPFKNGFVSTIRMDMSEIPNYVDTLLKLREEYKDRIKIYIGFEVECYSDYFDELMAELKKYPIDYMILGQHHVPNEDNGTYVGFKTDSEEVLKLYADTVIKAMKTELFAYLAHPDLINFTGPEEVFEKHMKRVIQASIDDDYPLEINLYGFVDERQYPSDRFFKLASTMGAKFIIGCDAHKPGLLIQPDTIPGFADFLNRNGIVTTDYSDPDLLIKKKLSDLNDHI